VPFEVLRTRTGTGNALTSGARTAVGGGADAGAFAEKLGQLVESVEETSAEANTAINGMIDKTVDVHEAMLALTKAEQTFQLTVQIRNKLVGAYQEIMRMPV
jgi:flagellar hook-basal body complex protein FliE